MSEKQKKAMVLTFICYVDMSRSFHIAKSVPTKGITLKMNRWPIQAPAKCADGHKSFV